ncbi:MAG TPA: dTMP kinase, partial [Candidatus Limnocylindrales bacterium]
GGKTTLARCLRQRIAELGGEVLLTREPGGTPLGDRIRQLVLDDAAGPVSPLTDALLFNAARAQLVADVIEPALARGVTVICVRFADSTLAYQGYGAGLALGDLTSLQAIAIGELAPDLTILLDLPVELGLARKTHEQTRFELGFDVAFHERVRAGFLALAHAEPTRFAVLDASRPAGEVEAAALGAVSARLPELLEQPEAGEPPSGPERMSR